MITADEIADWARRFRVPEAQVVRDHLISHLLVGIQGLDTGARFFGGTALCRTHLPDIRLSEDIDLLVEDPRPVAEHLVEDLPRAVRREFPRLTLTAPAPTARSLTLQARTPGVDPVQLQVVRIEPDERRLPFGRHPVTLRYSDLAETVHYDVPEPRAFVAMKMKAWRDRSAPRDLFDLRRLAEAGHVTPEAHRLLRAATGLGFVPADFVAPPRLTPGAWATELGHQTGDLPDLDETLAIVRTAVAEATAR